MTANKITCPNCGNNIDIDDVLTHQTEERIKKEMQEEMAKRVEEVNHKAKQLAEMKQKFEDAKKKENEIFKERLNKEVEAKIAEREQKIQTQTQETIRKEFEAKILAQQKMINEADERAKKLSHLEVKLMETERLMKKQKEEAEINAAKKMQEARDLIEKEAAKKEHEKWELKEKELIKKLEDQKKLTEEMQRKQQQGSMQLQGEVQELAIEEYLQNNFALDDILEIKKGARGGDCVQIVKNNLGQVLGKIYYESKRTKEFQPSWINKFKDDIREQQADIGVIITQAMPSNMDRFGLNKGIWICNFTEFKGLCFALREGLVRVGEVKESQLNKGDKMSILYDYFTSPAFKDTFKNMMDVFGGMKEDLEKEKRAMNKIWAMRDKQIERFLANAQNMYGSIKGIAGSSADFLDELDEIGLIE
jgi:hypothetical protein